MQYTNVSSPQWANQAQTAINCTVTSVQHGNIPFTAVANDSKHPYVGEIYARCVAGDFGFIATYVAPVKTPEQIVAEAKAAAYQADAASARSDNKINAVAGMTPAQARAWVAANVANFADAKDLLATMLAMLAVLARRL